MTFPSTNFYPLVQEKSVIIEMRLLYIFSFNPFKFLKFFFLLSNIKEDTRKIKENKKQCEQTLKEILSFQGAYDWIYYFAFHFQINFSVKKKKKAHNIL